MNVSFYTGKINKEGRVDFGWSYIGEFSCANMIKIKIPNGKWIEIIDLGDGNHSIREPNVKQHGN